MNDDSPNAEVCHVSIAQCTNLKNDEQMPAGELYTASAYFRDQKAYAEAVADRWFIQSAKYGLLDPERVIEPYDLRPRHIEDVDAWAEEIARRLALEIPTDARVDVLGGKKYADPLVPALERRGFEVHEPLRGLRLGKRRKKLREKAEAATA